MTRLLSFSTLSSLLVYADFAFRAYRSIRLVYYYWGRGSAIVPEVDITADAEPSNPFKLSTPRFAALVISSPATSALVGLLFLAWTASLLGGMYLPIYREYMSGCVNGGANGTFVGQNLFSVGYNYASQDGNSDTFSGLDAYDVKRADACGRFGGTSANKRNEYDIALDAFKESHVHASSGLR